MVRGTRAPDAAADVRKLYVSHSPTRRESASEKRYITEDRERCSLLGHREKKGRQVMRLSSLLCGACLLPLLLVPPPCAPGQATNQDVQAITSSLQKREYAKARELLQTALQRSPNSSQLWMLQGLAYAGEVNSKSALKSYKRAIAISPEYLPALEGAAQIEYEAGDADAIPLLQHVLRLRPDDPTSHAMLAVMAEKNGDCASAVEHYAASGSLLESQPEALQGYGACLLKLNQTEKAIPVFQRLAASRPDDSRIRRGLAAAQLSAGKPQDALATLQPILEPAPEVSTMRLAAAAYEANKDTPDAVKLLRDAIVKDPRQIPLYVDFAEIAIDHQSFDAGIEMVNAGLKLQPDAAPLYMARGVLYVELAEYEKAEADFERAEALDPALGISAAAQGMLAEEQNQSDPDRALATVRAKLSLKPGDAFLWYLESAILSQKSAEPGSAEFRQGMSAAQKAITLQPSLTVAHNVLAKYYLDSGQNAEAAKECRLVLEQKPLDQSALYHLVIALRKTGNQAEIPDILKRLAKARQEATREEGERNRYKLVVDAANPSK
jgi:tetratricopeptide (TPR) repeat protein